MTIEAIKELAQAAPFRKFSLRLPDGRSILVDNHDRIMFGPLGRTVVVYQPDERVNIIDVRQITDIEPQTS